MPKDQKHLPRLRQVLARTPDTTLAALRDALGVADALSTLSVADLLPLRSGEAELRGDSVGLSPYAACFLRLGQD